VGQCGPRWFAVGGRSNPRAHTSPHGGPPLQQVPKPGVGDDVAAGVGIITELAAQPLDEHIDSLGPDIGRDAIDLVQDLISRNGDSSVSREVLQQLVLEWSKVYRLSADFYL